MIDKSDFLYKMMAKKKVQKVEKVTKATILAFGEYHERNCVKKKGD